MKRQLISEEEKKYILERHRSYGYSSSWKDFSPEDEKDGDEDEIDAELEMPGIHMTEDKPERGIEELKKEVERLDKEIADKKEALNNIKREIDDKLKKGEQKENNFDSLLNADIDIEDESDSLEQGDY